MSGGLHLNTVLLSRPWRGGGEGVLGGTGGSTLHPFWRVERGGASDGGGARRRSPDASFWERRCPSPSISSSGVSSSSDPASISERSTYVHLKARRSSSPDTSSSRHSERERTGTLIWRDRVGAESSVCWRGHGGGDTEEETRRGHRGDMEEETRRRHGVGDTEETWSRRHGGVTEETWSRRHRGVMEEETWRRHRGGDME
ncbi:hypothetical protein CRUP_000148 [Coryphaenoides rupestris]|nr:hypothetical protein CRUP_000148 [Coryphaenoides rupestris]